MSQYILEIPKSQFQKSRKAWNKCLLVVMAKKLQYQKNWNDNDVSSVKNKWSFRSTINNL